MTLPRVVVDTNIFVSGVILKRGNPYELLQIWRNNLFKLIISAGIRAEIKDVLNRPKFVSQYNPLKEEIKKINCYFYFKSTS